MADQNNRVECRMIGGVCACSPGGCVVGLAAPAAATPAVPAPALTDDQIGKIAMANCSAGWQTMDSMVKFARTVIAASQSVPAPDAPTDDDELFAAKYYSSARPAPDVGGLIPEQQAHVLPPVAAPVSQHGAGLPGIISAGEYDRGTGMMYITVKLPMAGLPSELLTIGGAVLIAPADPEQAKLDSLALAGLAAALENRAKGEQMGGAQVASDDIEQRTERIRLAHANPANRSRTHLFRDVAHLLAHIALLRAAPATGAQVAKAEQIAATIMANLEDRRGVFEDIEDDIMQEIRDEMAATIAKFSAAPTTKSAAAPADLDTPEFREALSVYAQNHGGTGEGAARFEVIETVTDILTKSRAAEGAATSERNPLTVDEIWQIAPRHSTAADGIDPITFTRAIEQRHNIGSAK